MSEWEGDERPIACVKEGERSEKHKESKKGTHADLDHVWNGRAEGIKENSKRIPSWLDRISIAIWMSREDMMLERKC